MAAAANLVGREGVLPAVALGDALFHCPVHRFGIGGAVGHVGEAGSLSGLRLAQGLRPGAQRFLLSRSSCPVRWARMVRARWQASPLA